MSRPAPPVSVVVLDVNETLSDLSGLAARFEAIGADDALRPLWFASVLRDGFALTAAGASQPFAEVAAGALRVLLAGAELDRPLDDAVAHVVAGFGELALHDDVALGVPALRAKGLRLMTLSNGAATVARQLLGELAGEFEALLSVEDAGAWKPAAAAYDLAVSAAGVAPEQAVLVAVHPWDLDGAARAGLRTAWLDRDGGAYPSYALPPTWVASGLDELAELL